MWSIVCKRIRKDALSPSPRVMAIYLLSHSPNWPQIRCNRFATKPAKWTRMWTTWMLISPMTTSVTMLLPSIGISDTVQRQLFIQIELSWWLSIKRTKKLLSLIKTIIRQLTRALSHFTSSASTTHSTSYWITCVKMSKKTMFLSIPRLV